MSIRTLSEFHQSFKAEVNEVQLDEIINIAKLDTQMQD